MTTGDDGDAARSDTLPAGATDTSPGRVIAPPTIAGDESMLRQGDAVDRYRIDGYLGRGGMGVVYRARDPDLDRALAIKLVRSRSRGGDRMLREAQAMARLDHPNVVPIFDVGKLGEQVFLVMPFLSGGTIGEWCRAKPRSWHEVVRRYIDAGRGLAAAHDASIIHRDFKPDNVLIDHNGEVHVADFGLARAQHDGGDGAPVAGSGPLGYALTQAGELLGTPAYMAPEQLDGDSVDARADQFSFCVALYEGLYGTRPFDVPKGAGIIPLREAMRAGKVKASPADRDVPRSVRDAVLRGLRHEPAARWPSVAALLEALDQELTRRAPAPPRRATRRTGSGRVIAIGAAIAVVIAAAVWFAATRASGSRDRRPIAGIGPAGGDDGAPLGAPYKARALTFRGDLDLAALSPDGAQVAAMAGDDLVVTTTAAGGELRTLLPNIAGDLESLVWSDDGKRVLLVSAIDLERSLLRIVDVTTGAVEELERATWARAAFSGPREVASVESSQRTVRITPLDQDLPSRRCPLTGEIEWVSDILAAGGALFVIVAHHDQAFTVQRTDRNCVAPRAVLDHVPAGEILVSLDGALVGILRSRQRAAFVEWHGMDGAVVSRSRPLPAEVDDLVGRLPDGRLVARSARASWQLVPLEGGDPIGVGSSAARLVMSPDRTRVAIIDSRDEREAVRLLPLASLDARPPPIATDAAAVAWSPDGHWLAVVHEVNGAFALAVIEVATGTSTPLPAADVSPYGQLAWLDDRRVAYLRNDHKTFVAIDRESHQMGNVVPPEPGWTFELAVNPVDGTLALHWEREKNGVFIVPPGGAPTMVAPGGRIKLAWSTDGKTLWSVDQKLGSLHRHDRETGKTELAREIALDRGTHVTALVPMPDGSLLLQLSRSSGDLVVLE